MLVGNIWAASYHIPGILVAFINFSSSLSDSGHLEWGKVENENKTFYV